MFEMMMVPIQMKYVWMGIGFIQLNMLILVLEKELQVVLPQTILHDA